MQAMTRKQCDLVLEGGGVKGIGLVGAIAELDRSGYQFQRIAGASAGAIVGALIAAGIPIEQLVAKMQTLDYTRFRDESWLSRFGSPGKAASLLFTKGIYKGNYLHQWLYDELAALGIRTFADLRLAEPWAAELPAEQRYKLVLVVSDITSGRLVRLPWDYGSYGLDADKQLVADAIRASVAIPFFYQPSRIKGHYLVDGGMLSNFPIDLFDLISSWPTFGIKLSAHAEANLTTNHINNTVDYAKAIFATTINNVDQLHLDEPATIARTMFVDTLKVKATDFDIDEATQRQLYQNGQLAAQKFLGRWDFDNFKKLYGESINNVQVISNMPK
jgi:NTE family protein